jgi:hypothetical protein
MMMTMFDGVDCFAAGRGCRRTNSSRFVVIDVLLVELLIVDVDGRKKSDTESILLDRFVFVAFALLYCM